MAVLSLTYLCLVDVPGEVGRWARVVGRAVAAHNVADAIPRSHTVYRGHMLGDLCGDKIEERRERERNKKRMVNP